VHSIRQRASQCPENDWRQSDGEERV
jgi:hypothetical protein